MQGFLPKKVMFARCKCSPMCLFILDNAASARAVLTESRASNFVGKYIFQACLQIARLAAGSVKKSSTILACLRQRLLFNQSTMKSSNFPHLKRTISFELDVVDRFARTAKIAPSRLDRFTELAAQRNAEDVLAESRGMYLVGLSQTSVSYYPFLLNYYGVWENVHDNLLILDLLVSHWPLNFF